jgi:hypothetical protein
MTVYADRTAVSVGEQFTVTMKIVSSKQLGKIPIAEIPANNDFSVLRTSQNQSQSTSIQIINGKMTQSEEITYLVDYSISPRHQGTFTFPALSVSLDGQTYASNPFAVSVGKGMPVDAVDVSVRLFAEKKDIYVGEQTILTLQVSQKMQSASALTQQGFSAFADNLIKALNKSFAVTPLFKQLGGRQEQVNGEPYRIYRARYSLIALGPGDVIIPSLTMEYVLQKRVQVQRPRDPFEDFFGGDFFGMGQTVQQIPRSVASNPLTLRVKSLPAAPPGFSGAVGQCAFECSADPKTVAAGDAVTLKIAVKGNTRSNSLGEITLPAMDNIEAFTPEKHVYADTTEAGITSRKTYSFLLIPRQEGAATIPAIEWAYFDPVAGGYRTLSSQSIELSVTKGKGGKPEQGRYLTQAEIREVGSDIRYIKTPRRLINLPEKPYRNPVFWMLYPLPFLFALFSLLYRVQAGRRKDAAIAARQKALRAAFRQLDQVKKQGTKLAGPDFLGRIAGITEEYITRKFGFPATGRTLDELKSELAGRGVEEPVISALISFLQSMDMYRFGGSALDHNARSDTLRKSEDVVEKLEKAWRKEKRS